MIFLEFSCSKVSFVFLSNESDLVKSTGAFSFLAYGATDSASGIASLLTKITLSAFLK